MNVIDTDAAVIHRQLADYARELVSKSGIALRRIDFEWVDVRAIGGPALRHLDNVRIESEQSQ